MSEKTVGRYRIVKKLGTGGMGDVYIARDPLLDRIVALKILKPQFMADASFARRFLREARAASALSHSHVAHIYEIHQDHDLHFIAMEYVEGQTLSEKLEVGLALSETISLAIQIADTLDAAHQKGIIHRDIKPSNIMVTARGEVKILDFGLAKIQDQNASTGGISGSFGDGQVLGTLQYMSPEQALGKSIDARSDIFSLGVTLYEILTRRIPFHGANTIETLQKILHADPEPMQPGDRVPPQMRRIVLKCLEKDPTRRYQSARDLLQDLEEIPRDSDSGKITSPLSIPKPTRRPRWIFPILLLLITLITVWLSQRPPLPNEIRSVAVLPFVNESADRPLDYLSDGITENVIIKLSKIPEMKVMARGTVFTYKGKEIDPRKIGRDLGVEAIITGRLRQQGDNLNLRTSLVRTSDGVQLWGDQYSGSISEILTIENEMFTQIVERLRPQMETATQHRINKDYTKNVEAYQLYLKGRYYIEKRTKDDFHRAIRSFQEATALDPKYAPAYAGIADAFALLSNWGFLPPRKAFPRAKEAAQRAISLDRTLAEAYTSLATVSYSYDWDWKGAEKNFLRSIELNPNSSTAHHWYSIYLSLSGRHEEATREIIIAQKLDPFSLVINANVAYTYYLAHKYDQALKQLKMTIDLDPEFALAYQYSGYLYEQEGRYADSIAAFQKAIDLEPESLSYEADLARSYAASGNQMEAEKRLDRLLRIVPQTYVSPIDISSVYVGLERKEEAIAWIERAYRDRSDQVLYIGTDPRFDPLRDDPRFEMILQRIGLGS